MNDHHTKQRQAWLKTLHTSPTVDVVAAVLGALAFIAALFII